MYGSIRFYFDKTPDFISSRDCLSIFELFYNVLKKDYDYFSYTLWSADEDAVIIDRCYPNTPAGKELFLSETITQLVKGKNGDLSAPFVSAACNCKGKQIYSGVRIQIMFPVYSSPFTICVDFEEDIVKIIKFNDYVKLISDLQCLGYYINNGIYHVYKSRNEAETLNGGQIGTLISHFGSKNIKRSINHQKKGHLDSIMGIYYWNTIRNDLLSNNTKKRISEIVGNNNVIVSDNTFSFALSDNVHASCLYWIKHNREIKLLEKELSKYC